jgi:hypothetical protein
MAAVESFVDRELLILMSLGRGKDQKYDLRMIKVLPETLWYNDAFRSD